MAALTPNASQQKTALVVDDSKLARYVLKEMLVEQGIRVETAESAEEALGTLSAWKPDVIFMDHMMPGMDGFQAVQAIKNDPSTARIPILMYTSKDEGVYVSQARALGVVGVLPKKLKPVQLEKVLVKLNLIQKKPSAEENAQPRLSPRNASPASSPAAEKVIHEETRHTLEELARSAGEELEKDSMRLLFRQLFVEQRDCIKQDQHELLETMVAQVTPMLRSSGNSLHSWQKLVLAGLAALMLLILLPAYGVIDIDDRSQLAIQAQLQEQQRLIKKLASELKNISVSKPELNPVQASVNYKALEWAINQNSQLQYHESYNNPKTLEYLNTLIGHLYEQAFSGTVFIKYHAGIFCQQNKPSGLLALAADNLAISQCKIKDHEISIDTQSDMLEFENYLTAIKQDYPGIDIEFEEMGSQYTLEDYPGQGALVSAKEWNRVAALNNRLEFSLQPENGRQQFSLGYY